MTVGEFVRARRRGRGARSTLRVLALIALAVAPACNWTVSWGAGLGLGGTSDPWRTEPCQRYGSFNHQTLRQIVHSSLGGTSVRVRLSNASTTAVTVNAATVAVSASAAGTTPNVTGTPAALAFGGAATVSIPPSSMVISDTVNLNVPSDHHLAVSMFFDGATGTATDHYWAPETSFVGPATAGAAANLVSSTGSGFTEPCTRSSYFVSGVDVLTGGELGSVVVLGDSLSDGIIFVGQDSEQRWSDLLYDRLAATPSNNLAVANVAIAGESLNGGLARYSRDVLQQPGAETVVVLLGTNDLFNDAPCWCPPPPRPIIPSADMIADLQDMITQAHGAGLRIVGATIPPIFDVGVAVPTDPTDPVYKREVRRQEVNAWIRSGSTGFDAVVDFDEVLRDPDHLANIDPAFAGLGSAWHPSPAGHQAMADAIDLATL